MREANQEIDLTNFECNFLLFRRYDRIALAMYRKNLLLPVISFVLVVLFILGTACSLLPSLPPATSLAPTLTPELTPTPTETPVTPMPSPTLPATQPGWQMPAVETIPALPSIADVVAKVKPSVVSINIKASNVFNQTMTGAGSGWIIDKSGIIVTNNHVIEGATDITVTLDDGRTFPVDLKSVAGDSITDLAILKIGNASNLTAVAVGDSTKLRLGDWVIAIGNSLDLGVSPSEGIVRTLQATVTVAAGQTLYNLIGTTAAINPGNSGGPLLNMAGQVVGITSLKISTSGVEGMGYAISTQQSMPTIQQLVRTGYVVRPWLGVTLRDVDPFVVFRYNLAVDHGALIINVASGSPADKAGLRPGDVVTKFGNQDIIDVSGLLQALHASKIGQPVQITFWRDQNENTTTATLTESPPPS